MEKEIWRDIKGYEGCYQVSNKGRIKSLKRKGRLKERILKQPRKKGYNADEKDYSKKTYPYVHLSKNGVTKIVYVHKLVAKAFISNPKKRKYINHKDLDKTNNHVDNLEWCTQKENIIHAFKNGVMKDELITSKEKKRRLEVKKNRKWHKLSYYDALDIKNILNLNCCSQKEIADAYNVHQTTISLMARGKIWDTDRFN